MIDLLTEPGQAVTTHARPAFSWIVNDTTVGALQTACQILVASDERNLAAGRGDIWDSGKVQSVESTGVAFSGQPLEPNSRYWWKVRTWDAEDRAGPFSEPQAFQTGDFDRSRERWPGESQWVTIPGEKEPVFEDRHPIRYREIRPASISRNAERNHFITFGKAAFGTLRFRLPDSAAGKPITVRLGEKSTGGEFVDRNPGGSITFKEVTFEPAEGETEHTVILPRQISSYPNSQVLPDHMPEVAAFRFAEIENYPGELSAEDVRQVALLYQFDDDTSSFRSSDSNLNQVWEISKHTLKATPFLGLYIDGARERMPYEADSYIQQISHYCVDREYAVGRYTTQFLIYNPAWPTEWHLHIVLMAWADYMQTGDTRFFTRYYDDLKAKTLLALAREDGLISTRTGGVTREFLDSIHFDGKSFRDIVDWPQGTPANETEHRSGHGSEKIEGETDRFVFADINTVVNAFHYRNLVLMEKISGIIGKPGEAAAFAERAERVRDAFNQILFNEETGLYVDGEGVDHSSLHANLFPVAFGLAPRRAHASIRRFLQSKGMACSPYGAPYLLDALYALDAEEYSLGLLTSESDRSWMNMIRIGSTMTTEAWDMKYKKNMTWNHAWGASPTYIITRKLMGIEPLEPAFNKIEIHPRPGTVKSAEIETPTVRGPIHASFENEPGKHFTLNLQIPANTSARVILPRPAGDSFTVSHNEASVEASFQTGFPVIDPVPSGQHRFSVRATGA